MECWKQAAVPDTMALPRNAAAAAAAAAATAAAAPAALGQGLCTHLEGLERAKVAGLARWLGAERPIGAGAAWRQCRQVQVYGFICSTLFETAGIPLLLAAGRAEALAAAGRRLLLALPAPLPHAPCQKGCRDHKCQRGAAGAHSNPCEVQDKGTFSLCATRAQPWEPSIGLDRACLP